MDNAIRVSIAELLEVRGDGLYAPELLAIVVGACENLQKLGKYGLFSMDYVTLSPEGAVEVTLVPPAHVSEESVPPEMRDQIDYDDISSVREPQMVWCLGDLMKQACARACTDAELFSFVNFMTIHAVGGRPTMAKVGQMARNKCSTGGIEVVGVLKALYEEVMGDIDELLDDDAASSTGWSGTNGHTSQPSNIHQAMTHATHVSKDMPETPPSTSTSEAEEDEPDAVLVGRSYEGFLPPVIEEETHRQATKVDRRISGGSTTTAQSSLSEGTAGESRRDSTASDRTLPEISSGERTPPAEAEGGTLKREPSPELVRVKREDSPIILKKEEETIEEKLRKESDSSLREDYYSSLKKEPASSSRKESDSSLREEFGSSLKEDYYSSLKKESTSSSRKDSDSSLKKEPTSSSRKESGSSLQEDMSEVFPTMNQKKPSTIIQRDTEMISKISEEKISDEEADLPPPRIDLPPSPKLVPKASPHSVISARKKSRTGSVNSNDFQLPSSVLPRGQKTSTPKPNLFEDEDIEQAGKLSRHNSLEPGKVRRSSRRNKGPSPYYHQQQQNQGKKTFAVPEFVEKQNLAVVRLQAQSSRKKKLSLHRIEPTFVLVKIINGQTVEVNCKSDALVGAIFDTVVDHFKLTEHTFFGLAVIRDGEYFFLENDQRLEKYAPSGWKNSKRNNQERYTLHLRFRYYPKKLEFIKTQFIIHALYLQLRQDTLVDTLKPTRDKIFESAALALQAEFGDHPPPPRLGTRVPYFQLKNYLPARAFIDQESAKIETVLSEIHSHYSGLSSIEAEKQYIELCQKESEFGSHYYRIHKFKPSSNSPADRYADNYWVAIMPDGIGLCSQQGTSHTAFVAMNSFHPWHMIRTLQFDRKRFLIATIENNIAQDYVFYTDHYSKSGYLVRFAASQHRFMMKMRLWQSTLQRERPPVKDVGMERNENELPKVVFETMPRRSQPKEMERRSEEIPRKSTNTTNPFEDEEEELSSQRIQLTITLEKDPNHGLGLTLVDGVVDDVKGVYVKSVSLEGDAKKKGVEKGDCLQGINGVSLIDKTRHDAVELVKASEKFVELKILRFPYITQLISHERSTSKEEQPSVEKNGNKKVSEIPSKEELLTGKKKDSISRTPPASRKSSNLAVQARQRAVSDFGAVGDGLPALNTDDLIAGFGKSRQKKSDSESEDEAQKGEYRLPVTTVYNFHVSDDEEEEKKEEKKNEMNTSYPMDDTTSWVSKSTLESSAQRSMMSHSHRQNLDWTHELSDIEDSGKEGFGSSMERVTVVIRRLGAKSLGFQVATAAGFVYVKAVSAEPAISADLRVDDRIVSINGRSTSGMSHQDVVDSLRTDRSPIIELIVERARPPAETENTITVTLEKTHNTSLGLSLAKRMGHEGIFVRNIATGSVAEKDGRLRVGDRIWEIDGENVAEESTNAIVERLKSIEGRLVEIVVKRSIE